jgi:flagellar assembly protein FliH
VNELGGLRRRFRAEAEEATVALAITIARRVLNREMATDPEAILGLVKAAFQRCDARETYRLRVSPTDAEVVRENREPLRLPPAVEIVSDAAWRADRRFSRLRAANWTHRPRRSSPKSREALPMCWR